MRKTYIYLLLISFFVLLGSNAFSQKEGAVWYFGHDAGLDFSRHYPKPLIDGQIHTREGVASISTGEGDLLFYTDGNTVWNKHHQIMDNGTGLLGNQTSTQSSIIVPKPGSDFAYYIFTVDVIEENGVRGNGLNYSLVDMLRSNRLGSVVQKNINLLAECTEKITAVLDENGEDYWIIAHGWNSRRFYVYRLTKNGVSTPTEYDVGSVHENTELGDIYNRGAVGYMKSSPKGDYLAVAIESLQAFELFNFNNVTGEIEFLAFLPAYDSFTRPATLKFGAYGVEFSPTSNYLYGTTRKGGRIYRWDLTKQSDQKIRESREHLNPGMHDMPCGAIQLAFNGKMYICFAGEKYLGVINSPTQADSKFKQLGASLIDNEIGEGGTAYYGLPTFLPDFFKAAEFYFENTCQNDSTFFYLSTNFGFDQAPKWNIYDSTGNIRLAEVYGDPETFQGTHVFTEPGTFIVELIANQWGNPVQNNKRTIFIHSLPELNFADTTVLCRGRSVTLDAGDGAFYAWSDNVNLLERFRSISLPGQFAVRVTHNNGCIKYDTTQVVEKPLPEIKEIISIKASCGFNNGSASIITVKDPSNFIFDWKDFPGHNSNTISELSKGVYEVDIISIETGCSINKKIQISETGAPPVEIRTDHEGILCPGTEITLTAMGASDYIWIYPENIETAAITVKPYSTTTYIVEGYALDANDNRCSAFYEMTVDVHPYLPPELGSDRKACEGDEIILDGGAQFVSWNWSTGFSEQLITLKESVDTLWLMAEDVNGCLLADTLSIEFLPLPEVDLGLDRVFCKGDEIILDAGEADEFLWNTGDTTQIITVENTGIYSVLVTKGFCSNLDDVIIQINSPDSLRIDSVAVRDITCYDAGNGNIIVFAKGEGNGYEYSIDDGFNYVMNDGVFENIEPGENYYVHVIEDSACAVTWPYPVVVEEPDEIKVGYRLISPSCDLCEDGQIILDLTGGQPPYDILWSNFETGKKRINIGLGDYSVSVSDANNCKMLTTIELEMGNFALLIPNAFTPNADGINDYWKIESINWEIYSEGIVKVFDRFGQAVFESLPGYPEPWDGKMNGSYVAMGTYYYVIQLHDKADIITGNLTVIR